MIFPGATTSSGARAGWGSNSKLSSDDVDAIRREVGRVAYVSATIRTVAQVIYGNQNWSTSIQGGEVDWPLIRSWNVVDRDSSSRTRTTARPRRSASSARPSRRTCSATEDPVGKTIRIKNIPFRVAGVLESKGGSMMGQDQDDIVIAPYETVRKKLMGTTAVGRDPRVGGVERAGRDGPGRDHGPPAPAPPDQQGDGAGRRLHDPVADRDARAGRCAEPDDVDASLVDRGRLAPRRRDRDHEHHARVRDGADAGDRRAHGDRRQGRRHPRAVPRGGGRARRSRAAPRASGSASGSSGSSRASRAGRSRSSPPRSASRSRSRRSSGSRSASTRR